MPAEPSSAVKCYVAPKAVQSIAYTYDRSNFYSIDFIGLSYF